METIQFQSKYLEEGLTTFDGKPLFVEGNEVNTDLASPQDIYLDTLNLIKERESPSDDDLRLFGGAKNNTKQANQKKDNKSTSSKTKSVLDIHKIGSAILKELLGDKMNLSIHTSDDARLMKFILSFLNKHSYSLDHSEYEYLVRFLRDNLYKMVKESIMNRHSLAAISEYRSTSDMSPYSVYDKIACGRLMLDQKVAITREISNRWTGLDSLSSLMPKIKMEKNLIHPLFFILFANKLPGIEDLVIRNDYPTLIQQIKDKEIHRNNMFLFLLRMIDPELLPTTDKNNVSAVGNETLRMSIAMLLRELAYSIRRGVLEDKASCLLTSLLDKIKIPGSKFPEENMLQSILATFSFKPTLITRGLITPNKIGMYPGMTSPTIMYEPPKSVYTIEYPINDMYCFSDNVTPRLNQNNFELLGFDSATNKIVFTYSNNQNIVQEEQGNLLQNLFTALTMNRIEADVNNVIPAIAARQPAMETLYKNMLPVQVLLTNGFYLSIPREQNRFNTSPSSNIFFRPSFKPTINLSPVLVEPIITVNRITYSLVGALCYDIIDDDGSYFGSPILNGNLNLVDSSLKLGTFALVKSGEKWFEYNPQDTITLERKRNKLERMLYNRFISENPNLPYDASRYDVWRTANLEKVRKDLDDSNFFMSDLTIGNEEALELISTRACLLFYAEDYDTYQSRIFEKCF